MTGSSGNTIGPGNVVSGNAQSGILMISEATGNIVAGNLVGLDALGTAAVGNLLNGIIASNATGNTIGPGNVVSGNGTNGVRLRTGAAGNVVKGNLIGVNAAVTAAIPNLAEGVQLNDGAAGNTVGGPGADRNVISGNGRQRRPAHRRRDPGQRRRGQLHRLQRDGLGRHPERRQRRGDPGGLERQRDRRHGGGDEERHRLQRGAGRLRGVRDGQLGPRQHHLLQRGPRDRPRRDRRDAERPRGPGSGRQPPPELPGALAAVLLDTASTQVQGSLNSIASSSYRLEFFSSVLCDSSGNGPGQRFLGAADRKTDPGGNVAFVATLPSAALGPWITATATDSAGNTSEFSACLAIPGPTVASIDPTSGAAGAATPVTIAGMNFQNGATVTIGGAAAGGVAVMSGFEIDASTPILAPGTLNDVTVTNPSSLAASLSAGYLADFTDVPQDNIFHDDVETVFRAGITAGCGAGNFCVANAVTRAQMAVFLLKAEHGSSYVPPDCTGVFLDVPCPSAFADWIEQLSAEGITAGCGGGNYCPNNPVRRDQMAVFLLKTKNGSAYLPPSCTGVFEDVACPGPFTDWIEQLYADLITGGCSTTPLLYCPGASNTRGQMAVFLVKTFSL